MPLRLPKDKNERSRVVIRLCHGLPSHWVEDGKRYGVRPVEPVEPESIAYVPGLYLTFDIIILGGLWLAIGLMKLLTGL